MSFGIEEIVLRLVRLPSKEAFVTSGWTTSGKTPIMVELKGQGISGFGESAVPLFPFYNHESPQTALQILKDFAIPIFSKTKPNTPQEAYMALRKIIGNPFARAGLEMAYWDWFAKSKNTPLYKMFGGTCDVIPVGVSIGLQKSEGELIQKIAGFLETGYQRIKIKIAPGHDIQLVRLIMTEWSSLPLMVDANSAYRFEESHIFKAMDDFNLMMIEQPFRDGDIYDHSRLQKEIKNPICLDESITCLEDGEAAIALKSCKIINIKPGRVGGITEAIRIHDLAIKSNIPVWCGGMLETGIGRATNMALATLPGFKLPGDISESKRYYHEDIVSPEIVLGEKGTLRLPSGPGIGFEVNREALDQFTIHSESIRL